MSSSNCCSPSSTRSSPPLSPPGGWETDPSQMDEIQVPVVWCGGTNADQDVSIRLIPCGLTQQETDDQTLAAVKVHSSRLRTCSKYFAADLSERWAKRKRNPLECELEVHGEIACYTECFSRMYTPFLKSFKDVKHSLQLLEVASQIEFQELMSSICRYLSSVQWSDEDELRIRRYVASPGFPRSHAEELVARVESKEDCHVQVCYLIKQCVRSLHNEDNTSARGLLEALLKTVRLQQSVSSTFEKDLVTVINEEAKSMLDDLHKEFSHVESILEHVPKLKAIYCLLEALLVAEMGEEGVTYFLHLDSYPRILANAATSIEPDIEVVANEFAGLILTICEEVVFGNLHLGISDRVALLKDWLPLFQNLDMTVDCKRVAAALFSTLPFEQQMELLINESKSDNYDTYISPSAVATLLKDHWPAESGEMMAEVD